MWGKLPKPTLRTWNAVYVWSTAHLTYDGLPVVDVCGGWLKPGVPPPLRVFTAWKAWRAARETTSQIVATAEELAFKMSYTKPLLMPGDVENVRRRSTADPTGEVNLFQSVCFVRLTQSHVRGPFNVWSLCLAPNGSHLRVHWLNQCAPKIMQQVRDLSLWIVSNEKPASVQEAPCFFFSLHYGLVCNKFLDSALSSKSKCSEQLICVQVVVP